MAIFAGALSFCVCLNITLAPAIAKFVVKQTRQVPISRLLRNLEYQRADARTTTDKAMVDFRIGRLHAMAYSLGIEEAPCDANAVPGSKYEMPDFGHQPDHVQFSTKGSKNSPAAREHLRQAIKHLEAAVKTDPTLNTASLGLAWCIEQSGDKAKAIALYRKVFSQAYEGEKNAKGGMYSWSVACEAANYLKPLLDPVKDKQEVENIKKKVAQLEKLPRYITPVLIPLKRNVPFAELLVEHNVSFDLDGFGARDYEMWLSPLAAWLVFDPSGMGQVDSGINLIGQSSFWIFWQNGFEVLRGLDDDHDGKLSGSELAGLALWQDANCNGISEPGEVKPISDYGITELSVHGSKNAQGVLWNSKGVTMKDGSSLPSYDVLLPALKR